MSWVSRIWEEMLAALYPPRCAGCAEIGWERWCERCASAIPYTSLPVCMRCGTPVSLEQFCPSCPTHPLVVSAIRAVTRYEGVIQRAIHRYKYRGYAVLAPVLAELLVQAWYTPLAEPLHEVEMVIAMPIHPRRYRERGFNQSELLACHFCEVVGLPLQRGALQRAHYLRPQAGLDETERRSNIRGAFHVSQPHLVAGKSILLLDDVWTTGSTINEAARSLLEAGAREVYAYTVAHEPLQV